MSTADGIAIQDRFLPDMTCFGCGPANAKGLLLKSYQADGGRTVAEFTPWPEHDNGLGFLNGGIIATLLDCHSATPVLVAAHANGWVAETGLAYVTAGLDLRYRRPTPLRETLTILGELSVSSAEEMTSHVWIEWDGKVRAEADATWKRFRPRS